MLLNKERENNNLIIVGLLYGIKWPINNTFYFVGFGKIESPDIILSITLACDIPKL